MIRSIIKWLATGLIGISLFVLLTCLLYQERSRAAPVHVGAQDAPMCVGVAEVDMVCGAHTFQRKLVIGKKGVKR